MAALLEAGQEASAPIANSRTPYSGTNLSRLPGTPVAYLEEPASACHVVNIPCIHKKRCERRKQKGNLAQRGFNFTKGEMRELMGGMPGAREGQ